MREKAEPTGRRGRTGTAVPAAIGLAAIILSVSACSTGDVFSMRPAASAPESGRSILNPLGISLPHFGDPTEPGTGLSAEEAGCRRELKKLGVSFQDLPPINDGGECRIDAPISVSAIGSVGMKPAATLTCDMALAFAQWTRKELVPAARWRYFSGVKTIHQGSSYSCRSIRGSGVTSEHAKGNALDVMSIELNNGDDIDVKKPGFFSFWQRGFLNNVRADGCSYFSTVLGPGYNYDHRNHFHFDVKERRSGHRACH